MAKFPTHPILYEDCLQLEISFLKKNKYLKPNQIKSGFITWSRNGNKIGSISIEVNTQSESPYLELNYKWNEAPINYKVQLISAPSNLGKGVVWYFICPNTGKRCRKLYLVNNFFYHREAINGCMYKIQTESKTDRLNTRKYKPMYKGNEYDQLQEKYFKMFYNGKPTKRFLRITKKIMIAEALPDTLFDKFKFRIGK